MKKRIILFAALLPVLIAGCGRFTDIEPKGTNMLQKVSDLDMLLNYNYTGTLFGFNDNMTLLNDVHPAINVAYELINEPNKNPLRSALYTWSPSIDRTLIYENAAYTGCYKIVGTMCNPIILCADAAKGDRSYANRLKAEAYVLRAWFHYLIVNMFAKPYDPATAADEGGIPYLLEHDLLSKPNHKYTLKEVYEFILKDIESAFALNSLAPPSQNRMRINTAFAHAAKAKVLMSMHDYEGAYKAASDALAIENTVDDYNTMIVYTDTKYNPLTREEETGYSLSRPAMSSREDLFYAEYSYLLYLGITPELERSFEPGNIFYKHTDKMDFRMFTSLNMDGWMDNDVFLNPGGLSTVDMYLTQAECLIRRGDAASIASAMDIVNMIRRNRVATEVYTKATQGRETHDRIDAADYYKPYAATEKTQAMDYLKRVVHAECWFGIKRYICMKRWNVEPEWRQAKITKHVECLVGEDIVPYDFTLPYDSPLWVTAFPQRAVSFNPNLTQNY